jgi:hypothetical protein
LLIRSRGFQQQAKVEPLDLVVHFWFAAIVLGFLLPRGFRTQFGDGRSWAWPRRGVLPFLKVAFRLRVFLMLELLVLVGSLWRPNSGLDSIPGTQACSAQCKSQPRSPCQGWISHVCFWGSIDTSVWSLCSQGSVQGFSAVRAQDSTPQLPVFSSIGGSGLPTSSPCQRRRTPHQLARIVDSQKSSSPFRLYIHIYIHIY